MGRYVLGLDGGTGGMRAFVFDANGTPITSASQTYETSYPQPGRAEQVAGLVDRGGDVEVLVGVDPDDDAPGLGLRDARH